MPVPAVVARGASTAWRYGRWLLPHPYEVVEQGIGGTLVPETAPWWQRMIEPIVPDWMYQFPWQQQTPLAQPGLQQQVGLPAGAVGRGFAGGYGVTPGMGRGRIVTTVQRVDPTGQVTTIDAFAGRPYLARRDFASYKKVMKLAKRACRTRSKYTVRRRRRK